MNIEIKNRFNGEIIIVGEYASIKDALEKNKEANIEIAATKKELDLLTKTNGEKIKRINDLNDVIKTLESRIKDLID